MRGIEAMRAATALDEGVRLGSTAAEAVDAPGGSFAQWAAAAAATGSAFDAIVGQRLLPRWFQGSSKISERVASRSLQKIDDALLGVRRARAAMPEYPTSSAESLDKLRFTHTAITRAEQHLTTVQEYVRRGARSRVNTSDLKNTIKAMERAVSEAHEQVYSGARSFEHSQLGIDVDEVVGFVRRELDSVDVSRRAQDARELERAVAAALPRGLAEGAPGR